MNSTKEEITYYLTSFLMPTIRELQRHFHRRPDYRSVIGQMIATGELVKSGSGKKKDPYRVRRSDKPIPVCPTCHRMV